MTQYGADVLQGRALGVAEDQDVIEEHLDEIVEDVVHECLEHCRRVGEAERHYQELEMVVVCTEHSFLHVG
jgi:hypothetical protein